MNTRLLENNEVLRATVQTASVLETGPRHVLLKTTAKVNVKRAISSADSEMINQLKLAGAGEEVEGRLRIDVVADNVLRIRYAEGTTVPENQTLMLAGLPPQAKRCRISVAKKADGKTLTIRTAAWKATISLDPYRVEIQDLSTGRVLCGIGGLEKDNFSNWDSFNTGLCRTRIDGAPLAVESFDLAADEAVYGLGERFIKLNKVGQTIDLNMVDALGVTTPRSYKNVPFFMTTKGYGVFFNHSSLMTCWVGSRSAADVQIAAEDDFLDYFVITGSLKQILATYTDITGKGVMPPAWTFGYWQSKISYQSAAETLEIAREMRRHKVPCDVIHLDTFWFKEDWYCDLEFAKDRFPDPAAYLKELADMGFKVSLWQLPYIPSGSKLYDDLLAVDGFVKRADGSVYDCGICFTPGFKDKGGITGVVDYTNPRAVKVHQEAFRRLFKMGAKVIKTDFGEAAPLDGVYHDGTPGSRMHNLYPLLYNKALFEVTKEATGDGVVWARSAWAGNQRYPLHWGGDNSPNWFNIIPQMEGGLSFGLSGYQFWSHDIGGFCGSIDQELLIRWMQVGMFISHSRIHGFGDRELYKFAPKTLRICRDYINLRYRLMPYILGSAAACVAESLPMARALVLEFPDDPTTWNIGDQWMFGDSLLVAPIYTPHPWRRVYLPAGEWTDWWTRKRYKGGAWYEIESGLDTLPLFVREGAIIPMGPVTNYVDEKPLEQIELLIAPLSQPGTRRFRIPVNGGQVTVTYVAAKGKHTVTIGKTNTQFKVRMLSKIQLTVRKEGAE